MVTVYLYTILCLCISGGGGGWDGISNFTQSGRALLEGAVGGLPCPEAAEYGWEISGGFGGGGGGCTAGGGGGGYTGKIWSSMIYYRFSY